jgi:hypothetical protein
VVACICHTSYLGNINRITVQAGPGINAKPYLIKKKYIGVVAWVEYLSGKYKALEFKPQYHPKKDLLHFQKW